jgi:membrane-associated phospholipid phosphatase
MATQALISPAIVVARPSWSRYAASFNGRIGLLVLILVPAEIFLARRFDLYGLLNYTVDWRIFAILLCLLWYFHSVQSPRLIDSCQLAIWGIVLISVLSILVQIAGRSPYPLADRQLGAIDARMHFQTATIIHSVARLPPLVTILDFIYYQVTWLIIAAVLVPPLCGHTVAARRFVTGIVLAGLITVILFTFVPAAGPWSTQPYLPSQQQAAVSAYLVRLKHSGPILLDSRNNGIVSFPSFHVVYAILATTALSSIRRLRTPAWILATLICISTITTGWHYGIDVLAGIILSIVTIWLARQIEPDGCPAQHSH